MGRLDFHKMAGHSGPCNQIGLGGGVIRKEKKFLAVAEFANCLGRFNYRQRAAHPATIKGHYFHLVAPYIGHAINERLNERQHFLSCGAAMKSDSHIAMCQRSHCGKDMAGS